MHDEQEPSRPPGASEAADRRDARLARTGVTVVLDGSEAGWRALSWAIGYARARGQRRVTGLLSLNRPPMSWVRDPGNAYLSNSIALHERQTVQDLGNLARFVCDEDGIALTLAPDVCRGERHLMYMVRQLGPEIVIRGARQGGHRADQRLLKALTRLRVPVVLIP